MKLRNVLLGATALFFTSAASAVLTPTYSGKTTSDNRLIPPTNGVDAGYYIWNDKADTSTWYIRWTGENATTSPVSWYGNITFQDSNLGTVTTQSWNRNDRASVVYDFPWLAGGDGIMWQAFTNNTGGWDGIKFTLDDDFELLQFDLGSSLFSDLDECINCEGSNIYISDMLLTPNVTINEKDGVVYQQFEIAVPVPATLALFGLGLLGIGYTARRKKLD